MEGGGRDRERKGGAGKGGRERERTLTRPDLLVCLSLVKILGFNLNSLFILFNLKVLPNLQM